VPLVNVDFKGLEVFVAADWYNDELLKKEVSDRQHDLHADNQKRFTLPDRVTAKRFVFKLLYGATAYGYATDSDFISVGYSEKNWQKVIDAFYSKYTGIAKGHERDIKFVKENGYLEIPSGRYFNYTPKTVRGEKKWPLTKIKNYPIQGFGADLVKLARIKAFNDFKASRMEGEFVGTIHDSLIYDVPDENVMAIAKILYNAVDTTPEMCYNIYQYKFSLPLYCELSYGPNKFDMKEIQIES
jgi:DNA polymerase-1